MGSLGLGESYMDGRWDVPQLEEFTCRVIRAGLEDKVISMQDFLCYLKALVLNQQCLKRSYEVGEKHYDIGNDDLYECMLDKRMIYSCCFWKNASTFRRLFIKKLCQLEKN